MTAYKFFNMCCTVLVLFAACGLAWGFVGMLWGAELHRLLGFSVAIVSGIGFATSLLFVTMTADKKPAP